MIAPTGNLGGCFAANSLGELHLESGLGQTCRVNGKGSGFPVPFDILYRSSLPALAEPTSPDLGGPESSFAIEGHFYGAGIQSTQEIDAPTLVFSAYFLDPGAEVVGLTLVANEHLSFEGAEFSFRGIPNGTARGIGDRFADQPDRRRGTDFFEVFGGEGKHFVLAEIGTSGE